MFHRPKHGSVNINPLACLRGNARLGFSQPDRANRGLREHCRRDNRVVNPARIVIVNGFGEGCPLANGNRRQLRTRGDVTHCIDGGNIGL